MTGMPKNHRTLQDIAGHYWKTGGHVNDDCRTILQI